MSCITFVSSWQHGQTLFTKAMNIQFGLMLLDTSWPEAPWSASQVRNNYYVTQYVKVGEPYVEVIPNSFTFNVVFEI